MLLAFIYYLFKQDMLYSLEDFKNVLNIFKNMDDFKCYFLSSDKDV